MKQIQVVYIHGGMTFRSRKDYLRYLKTRTIRLKRRDNWSNTFLDRSLGKRFQIIRPRMPLGDNARFNEWALHFERYIPLLKNNVILIGESLGGIFLAKYLSEHRFKKKIRAIFLVGAPFDDTIPTEDLAGGFKLKSDISLLEKQTKNLFIIFSKNDDVVPVSHAKKYAAKLKNAHIIIYTHVKGHFRISTFPEIVRLIKRVVKSKK